ncbi:hypothetical protein KC352_g42927, partial [Hortaea werneckii]
QAIEMDERHGSPPAAQDQGNYTPALDSVGTDYGLRNSDADVMGMVGMQHGQTGQPSRKESERSASNYSGDRGYVPPRSQWAAPQHPRGGAGPVSPIDTNHPQSGSPALQSSTVGNFSHIMSSPTSPRQPPQHLRTGSDAYVEDVDPRFAIDPASEVGSSHHDQPGPLPSALTPGGGYSAYRMHSPNHLSPHPPSSTSNIPSYVSGGSSIASGSPGEIPSPAAAQAQGTDGYGGGEGSTPPPNSHY